MANSTRCAACKSLRKRCPEDCVYAPYFPSTDPQRFACVHKIFGASNISKMLQLLPIHRRAEAADCMSLEATWRVQDPVYGCVGIICQLQQQIIMVQRELSKMQGEIALHSAQQGQQQQMTRAQVHQEGEPSWFNATQQQDLFHLDQQSLLDFNHLNFFPFKRDEM